MHLSAPNYANSRVVPAADPRETTRKHVGKTTGSDFTSPTAALMSQTGRLRASGYRRVRKRQKIVLHARRLFQGAVHCTPYRAAGIDGSNPDTGSTGKADWPNKAYCRILAGLSCRKPARPARSGPCLTLFRPLLEGAGEIGSRVERSRRTNRYGLGTAHLHYISQTGDIPNSSGQKSLKQRRRWCLHCWHSRQPAYTGGYSKSHAVKTRCATVGRSAALCS